jgi:hypothetical protein
MKLQVSRPWQMCSVNASARLPYYYPFRILPSTEKQYEDCGKVQQGMKKMVWAARGQRPHREVTPNRVEIIAPSRWNDTQNLLGAALPSQQEYSQPDQTEHWRNKLKANHGASTSPANHGQP